MLQSFVMPPAEDASDEKLLSDIEKYGWHVVGVFEEENSPGFTFTVGLYYQFEHPEILIMGLPQQTAHALLTTAVEMIREGFRFEPGQLYPELANFPFAVAPIHLDHYKEHLGYGIWFYRSLSEPFPAIQLIWPDKAGFYPWQEGYEAKYAQFQKVLSAAL